MITCTKCGARNPDEALHCMACSHKLQSSRAPAPASGPGTAPLERLSRNTMDQDTWRWVKRMIEAWVYLLLLAGVATGCLLYQKWWPMYPAVLLLGLLLWLRKA